MHVCTHGQVNGELEARSFKASQAPTDVPQSALHIIWIWTSAHQQRTSVGMLPLILRSEYFVGLPN